MCFTNQVRITQPILMVKTYEELRVLARYVIDISKIKHAAESYHAYAWDIADGIRPLAIKEGVCQTGDPIDSTGKDPLLPLTWLHEQAPENTILFLKDYHPFLRKEFQDSVLIVRTIRNCLDKFKSQGKIMVLLGPSIEIPLELDKEVKVIDFKLPTQAELKIVLKKVCEDAQAPYPKDDESLLDAALGMTATEAESSFSLSLVEANKFDAAIVRREKSDIVKKTGLLEVITSSLTLDDVGGLENLKEWLVARKDCFTPTARAYGVTPPKGMLLVGVPGCGKSLICKVVSTAWGRPLLRLDMGSVFGSYVGESEHNMKKVLDIAEAVAPCLIKGTKVLMADGSYQNIEDLYKKYPNGGFSVMGYDELRDLIVPVSVVKSTRRICEDVYKVNYSDGTSIGYSWNHLQPVMRNGKLLWIPTENICIDDYVAQPVGGLNISSTSIKFYLPSGYRCYKEYGSNPVRANSLQEANHIAIGREGYTDSVLNKWPSKITSDFTYLLGLIKSDGSLGKRRIAFTNSDRKLCHRFSDLMMELFGLKCKERYISSEEAKRLGSNLKELNQKEFSEHWVLYADSKVTAEILRNVYTHIHGFSSELILSFLSGYTDGDGCICPGKYPRIIFCSKKPVMTRVIRDALKRVRIIPSIGTSAGIVVSGKQVELLKGMQLSSEDKARKLNEIRTSLAGSRDRVRVFPLGRLLTEMRESLGMKTNHFKSTTSSEFFAWEHCQRAVPENRLITLAEEVRSYSTVWSERLLSFINSPLRWVKVVTKSKLKEQPVYDLCCEKTHNFIADGILTHNCCLWCDEIEKSMSGNKAGMESHETTRRVFQLLLTWMQDRVADVFLVATANSIQSLPPELIRPGRIDATFWVDLPDTIQRAEIFGIHLRKLGRTADMFLEYMPELMKACAGFSGAEIEVWIKESLVKAYSRKHKNLELTDLIDTVKDITPIAKLMASDIDNARKWAENRGTKNASIKHEEAHVEQKPRKIVPGVAS